MPWKKPWAVRRVRFAKNVDTGSPPRPPADPPPSSSPPRAQADRRTQDPLPKRVDHKKAAQCYGYGPNILDGIRFTDRFREERKGNIFYPFSCEEDMEMGIWLADKGLSINQIDTFLRLKYVQRNPLSFTSAAQLIDRIEILPKTPSWKCCEIEVEGGTTKSPIKLFYRDGWECLCFLFGNPAFDGHLQLSPFKLFEDDFQKIQIFGDPMSGNYPWRVQDSVGEGETLGLVMLASDEARLTEHYGDKATHGVYMSCGNISKEIRGIASAKCWMKVAEIPIVRFKEREFQGMLSERLAHKCLDIVTSKLKKHSHNPAYTPDPSGRIRLLRPILCAHLMDGPEQTGIACCLDNSSPISIANFKELGRAKACRPRTATYTLNRIETLIRSLGNDRSDLSVVSDKAKVLKLNGVLEPYWRDWKFADPSIFITPDALHQWHGFFMDHPMEWARELLNDDELDKRISVLQHRIGFRSFANGFTRFKQHTGREERDLQRSFVAIIAGHPRITPNVLRAFRSLLDYIYIAQYDSQSTETLRLLRSSLRSFHRNKGYISRTGVRDGIRKKGKFKIRKLETFHHTPRIIQEVGSAPQFSTDHSEHLHIDNAKVPYRKTNHKDYEEQICRILDRRDKMALFSMFIPICYL
ncbi:hypothetical protein SCHPADRAFT_826246 [Schizopora paradoxa]|uniref:Uncharacterized protein n=1 Tax=Schizopora paradoxa TaxID=27342 RepID=A0A0H2RRF8_9AGAM|nr:hypothetical protein SCHPADRAFT_826246 [Schizopora paradoxa]